MGTRSLKRPASILFICYGNACRSPMAESVGRRFLSSAVIVSAGIVPLGFIPPETSAVLREAGFEDSGLVSKPVTEERLAAADLAIDLSGYWTPPETFRGETASWPVTDPYRLPIDVWRRTRDDLIARIRELARLRGFAAAD